MPNQVQLWTEIEYIVNYRTPPHRTPTVLSDNLCDYHQTWNINADCVNADCVDEIILTESAENAFLLLE